LQTKNLTLIPHVPAHLFALAESSAVYEARSSVGIAAGVREFLLQASPDFLDQLRKANSPDPWRFGFAIVHTIDRIMIGMCGFTGPPDSAGAVELAYSIAPGYQGKGYATEAAVALIEFAQTDRAVKQICAHTLAERNASARVLEKSGFTKIGELVDSENQPVWKWARLL
jgi:[ribosomal protein S5]-alanine N-acetyltransferase